MPDRLDPADSILYQWARWSKFGGPMPKEYRTSPMGHALTVLKNGTSAKDFSQISRDDLVLIDQLVAKLHPQHRGALESCYLYKVPADTPGRSAVLKKARKAFMKLYENRMEQARAGRARLTADAQQVRQVRDTQGTQRKY